VRLVIKGIGWVTPSGIGCGRPSEIFELGPGQLPVMKSRMFLEATHPRFGRFDSYTKAGFGAIALALKCAGMDQWQQKRDVGLVVGTHSGCIEADLAYFETAAFEHGAMASPNLFSYTLPSCMLGEASIQFGLTGPCFVVDDSDNHMAGIFAAVDMIRLGFCQTMVAGWCDVNSKRLNINTDGACGAVFFLLARGSDSSLWQCDGSSLTYGAHSIFDISQLAQLVLKDKLLAEENKS
jgi:3-oxoacyl-[acyl-carrier-protein] synthase II